MVSAVVIAITGGVRRGSVVGRGTTCSDSAFLSLECCSDCRKASGGSWTERQESLRTIKGPASEDSRVWSETWQTVRKNTFMCFQKKKVLFLTLQPALVVFKCIDESRAFIITKSVDDTSPPIVILNTSVIQESGTAICERQVWMNAITGNFTQIHLHLGRNSKYTISWKVSL